MNQIDPNLLRIFSAEQAEHIGRIRQLAESLSSSPPEARPGLFDELLRRAHTLKGAARAVGLEETESLAHGVEEIFIELRVRAGAPDAEALRLVHESLDRAEDILAQAQGRVSGTERPRGAHPTFYPGGKASDAPQAEPVDHPPHDTTNSNLVRVDAETLDAVVRTSASVIMAATAQTSAVVMLEQHAADMDETLAQYWRLRRSASHYIHDQAEDPGFAPIAECLSYLENQFGRLRTDAHNRATAHAKVAWQLHRQVRELHAHASRARLTPAETVFGAFGAMARDMARQQAKDLDFRAEGLHVQADRLVLQALKDPVMHLLRNAISHGIELPAERRVAGKPPAGSLRLLVRSRGDRLTIAVEDDGRGLNREALIRTAVARGMLTPSAASASSFSELAKLTFLPGFSTSGAVTELAGRGMGLSVVKQAADAHRGDVTLRARKGGGTVVYISVPLSISTEHVVLVAERGHTFAIPSSWVADVRRIATGEITRISGGQPAILVDTEAVPLVRLADLIGLDEDGRQDSPPAKMQIVTLATDEPAAVVVERVLEERESIVKPTGLEAEESALVNGAVPLEDGGVAVVLNVSALLARFRQAQSKPDPFIQAAEDVRVYRILVVDDSVTTRSVEKNILEAHGYQVELAVDGMEALEKIRTRPPDLVISDVAMPRMDGFELLERLKSSGETSHIPVILVTSLEARQEQERGLSLGAAAYIVKRKFDQRELLEAVKQML